MEQPISVMMVDDEKQLAQTTKKNPRKQGVQSDPGR